MDILAVRLLPDGKVERRHIEVQASIRPISYICRLPKDVQKATGRPTNSAKRSGDELVKGVEEWVEKKFLKPKKIQLLSSLGKGEWSRELVIHNVKSHVEVDLISKHGIKIIHLSDVVKKLRSEKTLIESATGADLLELMHLASEDKVIVEAIEAVVEAD